MMICRKRMIMMLVAVIAASIYSSAAAGQQGDAPRVVSLDFCADQYVMSIFPESAILALSPDAGTVYAAYAEKSSDLRQVRPRAETLLALEPTFVVRQWGGDATTLPLLERHGIGTFQLGYVTDFAGIANNLTNLATATGQTDRARGIIIRIDEASTTLGRRVAGGPRLRALYVTPGGVTAGQGTLMDAIMAAAGVTNIASEAGLTGWPPLPAEALVMDTPDLIITGYFDDPLARGSNWSMAYHPVFETLFDRVPTIHLPPDLISCAGPASVEAAVYLRDAIDAQSLGGMPERPVP